jgi:hypothetical protein
LNIYAHLIVTVVSKANESASGGKRVKQKACNIATDKEITQDSKIPLIIHTTGSPPPYCTTFWTINIDFHPF